MVLDAIQGASGASAGPPPPASCDRTLPDEEDPSRRYARRPESPAGIPSCRCARLAQAWLRPRASTCGSSGGRGPAPAAGHRSSPACGVGPRAPATIVRRADTVAGTFPARGPGRRSGRGGRTTTTPRKGGKLDAPERAAITNGADDNAWARGRAVAASAVRAACRPSLARAGCSRCSRARRWVADPRASSPRRPQPPRAPWP